MTDNKITELGLTLPALARPLASYVPVKKAGNLIFTSGQLPLVDGNILHPGKLGETVTMEMAQEAARAAILNALAAIKTVIDLDKIEIIKLGVFVASAPSFTEHHLVANGASDLLEKIFGDKGKHVRFAVGMAALPLNACVELELTVTA